MKNLYTIWRIALYEAKLLFRSWGFRIFSGLGLVILTLINIGIGTTVIPTPYFFHSLSGSLPLNSIKLFNVFQGIIAAFLATEFFKRDRKHDTTQVVFARSFSNVEYTLGKAAGILGVFAVLNIAVVLITFVIHLFFSKTLFAWLPYLLYPLLISLPTVVFIVGISILLVTLVRSQAVVFILMLGYSFLVLVFIGSELFCLFDSFAFYQPLIYSDFIGMGNLGPLLLVRGVYLFLGLGFILIASLLSRRLRQSTAPNIGAGIISLVCILLAVFLGYGFIKGKLAGREFRDRLKASGSSVIDLPTASVTQCDIQLQHEGDEITANAKLEILNSTANPLDAILLTLNPGLRVHEVSGDQGKFQYRRDDHLLKVFPASPLKADESVRLSVSYSGIIDERYCYLDVTEEQMESRYRLWLYDIPKRYAVVTPGYVILTPESGWYPVSGLPPGAAFPSSVKRDFVKFSLSVTAPQGMTAISQGEPVIESSGDRLTYSFKPKTLLPQISLTMGNYEQRRIEVDKVVYSLYTLPGHDYFTPYFDQLGDALPGLIRELKNEYEVVMGLEYPYGQLSLVEVPIQFFSYQRLWTSAQEMVQPQVVFLPEMGTLCSGADFHTAERMSRRMRGRRNMPSSPKETQTFFFHRFFRSDFMGMERGFRGFLRGTGIGGVLQANVEPRFELFPNFVSYVTYLSSSRWPVLHYALESYLKGQASSTPPMFMRFFRGLSTEEETNLLLKGNSLSGLLGDSSLDTETLSAALQAKGSYLMSLLEAKLGKGDFKKAITGFISSHGFRTISENEWTGFITSLGNIDLPGILDAWYNETLIPGFLVENMESYQLIDGERTRTQVKFRVTNPTDVEGIIKISFRFRRGFGPGFMRGQAQEDYSRVLSVPGMTVKEVGLVIDQPPAVMTIDTYISQNIPSAATVFFRDLKLKRDEQPLEVELSRPYEKAVPGAGREYVVDNEDPGFEIPGKAEENWLRRTLRRLFGSSAGDAAYIGFDVFRPPANWSPATFQDFYGRFIRSGFFKKSGNGQSKVAWNVELEESGDYDVYFYYEGSAGIPPFLRRGRDRGRERPGPPDRRRGKKYFLIYHEDGVEEVQVDLGEAETGWNHLGTYRLTSGKNRVEMTDNNDTGYVTADAVKWVKKEGK